VKRIQTMIEFFSCCLQIAWAFKGSGNAVNFDLEFLTRPLKAYISEYLMKFVLGRSSFCLSVIICCMLEHKQSEFKSGNKCFSLDQMCFMTVSNSKFSEKFFVVLEERFRKEEAAGYFKTLSMKQSEYVNQMSHILNAHHWLHEEFFMIHPNMLPSLPRASLMIQLQNVINQLTNWSTSIQKIQEELKQCSLVVLQRLKWASGANPMVNELMRNFESISNAKAIQLEREKGNATMALKHCCSVLNYEMLRFKTPKAIINDEEFLNFLQQWENVCIAERNVAHTVNPIEEALVELLDPEGKIERAWINNVTSLIDDIINQVHSDIDENEKGLATTRDMLDMCAHKLRSFIASHHRISADIRNLLKSMLKHDDSDHNNALKEYLMKYKIFIDNVTELHGNVLSKDFTDVMVKRTIQQVDASLAVINEVYNDLFTFEKTLSTSLTTAADSVGSQQRRMMRNQSENYSIEYPGSPVKRGLFVCLLYITGRQRNAILMN
jgi:serine/threonine-protein kinase SMG1